ncbi:hypothetical protein C8R43DRAFT_1012152 [Mycena crocata]|nr:hypothetical protein C8R43DRAFT_1012152 [Mycena crocata]
MATTNPPQPVSDGQLTRDADFLIQSFLPIPEHFPSPYDASGMPLPFCTPQIAMSFDSPFARGYSPILQSSANISQEQLLGFLDGLNLAMTSSPPLRVVNLAGKVIGFVPYHWAMIAGALMQTAAQTGNHILSKTLTDRYLRAANLRLFKPRGLVVRLCTSAAMQHFVMRTGNGEGPSTMTKIGRGVGSTLMQLPLPFTSRIVRAIADKPHKVAASISDVGDGKEMPLATQRRLAALEGYALPLEFNVPPPAKAQGIMDTMGSWGVSFDAWRAGREQNKVEQRRRHLAQIEGQLQRMDLGPHGYAGQPAMGGGPSGYNHTDDQMYDMGRRERRELRRAARRERKRQRGGGLISGLIGPKESRLERRVANADLLEQWGNDKVLWVVIMNAELDGEIEGIERAESLDNVEEIKTQTWQAQIVRERDALEEEEDEEELDNEKGHHWESKHA